MPRLLIIGIVVASLNVASTFDLFGYSMTLSPTLDAQSGDSVELDSVDNELEHSHEIHRNAETVAFAASAEAPPDPVLPVSNSSVVPVHRHHYRSRHHLRHHNGTATLRSRGSRRIRLRGGVNGVGFSFICYLKLLIFFF